MKLAAITFIVVLGSAIASAQAAGQAAPQHAQSSQTFSVSSATSSCPVSLRAMQGAGGGLIAVRDAKPTPGPSQRIHLVVGDTSSHVISAQVTVRGLSGRNQVIQTADKARFDLTKRINVQFFSEDDGKVAANLILPGFTSVQSIELESIRYQDGSTWTFAGHEACHVAPDPFMLIAGR
jgi:hypothetical protein